MIKPRPAAGQLSETRSVPHLIEVRRLDARARDAARGELRCVAGTRSVLEERIRVVETPLPAGRMALCV